MADSTIDWRKLARDGEFDKLNFLDWTEPQKLQVLSEIKECVPKVSQSNELLPKIVYAHPNHRKIAHDPALAWAAEILLLGELEADLIGEPPTYAERWLELETQIIDFLAEVQRKSDESPAQAEHSLQVREGLAAMSNVLKWTLSQCKGDDEREWIEESLSEAFALAFDVGRHAQAMMFHPHEKAAIGRHKQEEGFSLARDADIILRQEEMERRQSLIEGLMGESNRTKGALVEWLKVELEKKGISVSERTIRRDLKALTAR